MQRWGKKTGKCTRDRYRGGGERQRRCIACRRQLQAPLRGCAYVSVYSGGGGAHPCYRAICVGCAAPCTRLLSPREARGRGLQSPRRGRTMCGKQAMQRRSAPVCVSVCLPAVCRTRANKSACETARQAAASSMQHSSVQDPEAPLQAAGRGLAHSSPRCVAVKAPSNTPAQPPPPSVLQRVPCKHTTCKHKQSK